MLATASLSRYKPTSLRAPPSPDAPARKPSLEQRIGHYERPRDFGDMPPIEEPVDRGAARRVGWPAR